MKIFLLISSIILQVKLPKVPSPTLNRNNESDKLYIIYSISTMSLMTVIISLVGWEASHEQFGLFLFGSVINSFIQQLYPLIFLMNHPKLKEYGLKTLNQWSKSKLVVTLTPDLTLWKNVFILVVYFYTMGGCFGLLFEYKWPKASKPSKPKNVIVPVWFFCNKLLVLCLLMID